MTTTTPQAALDKILTVTYPHDLFSVRSGANGCMIYVFETSQVARDAYNAVLSIARDLQARAITDVSQAGTAIIVWFGGESHIAEREPK